MRRVAPALWMALTTAAFVMLTVLGARANDTPISFADLAEKVSPAVVDITTSTVIEAPTGQVPGLPDGSPFQDLFPDQNGQSPDGGDPR